MRFAATAVLLLLLTAAVRADEAEYRMRRVGLDERFAAAYMEIAAGARKLRAADLAEEAFRIAEKLDPVNEAVMTFDPDVQGEPKKSSEKRIGMLREDFARTRVEEAKERIALALWCDEEALPEQAQVEACAALRTLPGPVSFDERGTLSTPRVGELPTSLSIAVLEEHDVYRGRLVPLADLPEKIAWEEGWLLETKHFLIQTNVSGKLCRRVGRVLESAREVYRRESGFDVAAKITVFIVAERKAYEELWVAMDRPRPKKSNEGKCVGDFCGVDGSKPEERILTTAIHEVAHGYYNLGHAAAVRKRPVEMPVWFKEGFATFCAGYGSGSLSWEDGIVLPEIAKEKPLARFKEMVEVRSYRHLGKFLEMGSEDSAFYLQAYAFYWFMKEVEDPDLRDRLRTGVAKMVGAAIGGEDAAGRLNEIFLGEIGDLDALERKFLDWVLAR